MNALVLAIITMIFLGFLRFNVVLAILFGALAGGLSSGFGVTETMNIFVRGLGGGAEVALSYALLGAFAMGIYNLGISDVFADKLIAMADHAYESPENVSFFRSKKGLKYLLFGLLALISVCSQNLIPIHIAFIPIIIPPLLSVFTKLNLDRRAIACIITFGLTATYIVVPVGFGSIYLNNILSRNLEINGLDVTNVSMSFAMLIPVAGMFMGLLFAVFSTYSKPRTYRVGLEVGLNKDKKQPVKMKLVYLSGISIVGMFIGQMITGSMIFGALLGCSLLIFTGAISWRSSDKIYMDGIKMMAYIGAVMIAAAGFSEVLRASDATESLVASVQGSIFASKAVLAFVMLVIGLLVTLGTGSSFSTVPILAPLYVPIGLAVGFSPLAIASIVGTAGALGDAGSPISESTIGPSIGLNYDGQHDHIKDTVIPTFLHFNLPLIGFGWLAAMVL